MEFSPQGIIAYASGYIQTMPAEIMQGDVFALTFTLIAFFIAVVIINKLTGLLIVFLKKIILFIIVTLAFWQFVTMFYFRVTTEGLTNDTIIFGAVGFIVGFIAISISLYVALQSFYEARAEPVAPVPGEAEVPGGAEAARAAPGTYAELKPSEPVPIPATEPLEAPPAVSAATQIPVTAPPAPVPESAGGGKISAMRETLSVSNLKSDKSLGAVLAYLVVAQFGVFSSKTMPAPSFQVGVAFFVLFIIAGLFFIHFTYNNYLTGLRHLGMAIIIGTIIAMVLGYFWGNIPLDQLFSLAFFQTDALVALVTGLALSLFMGGKG